jgi:hypothetical protein
LLVGRAGRGQTTTGNIEGTVRDTAGGALPGVTLQASSPSLQGVRVTSNGPDGRFRFQAVPPGTYAVRAALAGFRASEKSATITLDSTATVDFELEPEMQEAIAVTGEAPLVDTRSTTTGTTYTSRIVTHLPVSRNYADIVRSNPGVLPDNGETQGRSIALSIYGSTSVEHQWIIDGINTTNVVKGVQGKAINNEFVQEVEVKTGGYQAEYGRALGGVINVITKSGGNAFHGDAFVYYDSDALQANRRFEPGVDSDLSGMRVADYSRTDYGFDLGGFIVKDRLWFFAAYNRVSYPAHISRYVSGDLVPSTMRFPLEETDNLYSGKLTWNIAVSSVLVGSVFADPTTNSGAGLADPRLNGPPISSPDPGTWESNRTIGGTDFGLRLNQLFGSSGLLTLQGARHRDKYGLVPTGPGLQVRLRDFRCEGGTPESSCEIPGQPNFVQGGLGSIFGPINNSQSHRDQARADATIYRGGHELKFGGDYQDGHTDTVTFYTGGQQVSHYNEYGQDYYAHEFYARNASDLTPTDWTSSAVTRDFGAYVQDSWRAVPNLTINAGVRFDREWVIKFTGQSAFRTDEWQPRLGIVWDPIGDGTSKVYAFAGRFSYGMPTDLALRVWGGTFFITTYNFDPSSLAQDPNVYKHEKPQTQGGVFGEPVDAGMKGISQEELTLGVEKTLEGGTLSLGLKATYRTLSSAIEDRCDLDYSAPENNSSTCAMMNPGSNGPIARGDFHYCTGLDAEFNNCNTRVSLYGAPPIPKAKRIYRGIELLLRKSFTRKLWLQASYVYSSLRGNYDGEVSEGTGQTDPGINADYDYAQLLHNAYGRLYLDRPHQLRVDAYYVAPLGLSIGLQAWLRSGAPLNKYGYLNAYYSILNLVPKGYAGRLPAEWEANLTLEYPVHLGPVTATLQAYVFNLFNNQIRTDQDTTWTLQQPRGYPATIYDPNQPSTNGNYGKITRRSGARLFRAAVRISF